jgi:hypothetical protein
LEGHTRQCIKKLTTEEKNKKLFEEHDSSSDDFSD